MAKTWDLLTQHLLNPLLINLPLLQRLESSNLISQGSSEQWALGCDLDSAKGYSHMCPRELAYIRKRRKTGDGRKLLLMGTDGEHVSSKIPRPL